MIQRSINFWYTISLDLFGSEVSSNAANYFAAGLKGRAHELRKNDDHVLLDASLTVPVMREGKLTPEEVPLRNALNQVLRDEYMEDNQRAVDRWNRVLERHGISDRLRLPAQRFHRRSERTPDTSSTPKARLIDAAAYEAQRDAWLINDADLAYLKSIQHPVVEPGKMAHWIAPPERGIKGRPIDFEYVRL